MKFNICHCLQTTCKLRNRVWCHCCCRCCALIFIVNKINSWVDVPRPKNHHLDLKWGIIHVESFLNHEDLHACIYFRYNRANGLFSIVVQVRVACILSSIIMGNLILINLKHTSIEFKTSSNYYYWCQKCAGMNRGNEAFKM